MRTANRAGGMCRGMEPVSLVPGVPVADVVLGAGDAVAAPWGLSRNEQTISAVRTCMDAMLTAIVGALAVAALLGATWIFFSR